MAPRKPIDTAEKTEKQGPAPDPTMAIQAAIEAFGDGFKELKLEGKISTISGFLGRIPKNGYNKFNKYPYVLESDLVEHIRYWLAAARILIYPSVKDWKVSDGVVREGRSGDPRTDVLYTFHVIDGYTGDRFEFDALGQGSDPRDKGANKASTSAMKFAYLRLFNIASGEDAENDEKGDADAAAGSKTPAGVTVTPGNVEGAQRGGKQESATGAQIKAVSNLSNQLNLGGPGLVAVIKRVLGTDVELPEDEREHGKVLAPYLKGLKGEEIGKLIYNLQQLVDAAAGEADGAGGYGV